MNGDVGVHAQEGGGRETAEAVEPRKDFVKDDGETSPFVRVLSLVRGEGRLAKEMGGLADRVDESTLE